MLLSRTGQESLWILGFKQRKVRYIYQWSGAEINGHQQFNKII